MQAWPLIQPQTKINSTAASNSPFCLFVYFTHAPFAYLLEWQMPFVLFKVIQGVLGCDCFAEKGCQGTDKHVNSTSSQLRLESKTLIDPYIMYTVKDMAVT